MGLYAKIIITLIIILHVYILWLEMFGWTTRAKKIFRGFPPELFEKTRPMAANQGLYNGFLAGGLFWSLFITDAVWSTNVGVFFLGCIFTAGMFGGFTVQRSILYIQALPALLALLCIYFNL